MTLVHGTRNLLLTVAAASQLGSIVPSGAAAATFTVLHRFTKPAGPQQPQGELTALKGLLFGISQQGGAAAQGTVFVVNPGSGKAALLYAFTGGADGGTPTESPIAYQGMLYGTAAFGGTHNLGVVFKLDPGTGIETPLYNFAGGTDGENPVGQLVVQGGALYGTTYGGGGGACNVGGATGCGTIFKINPVTGSEQVLYRFAGGQGSGTLTTGLTYANGSFWGTAAGLGNVGSGNYGALFKLDASGDKATFRIMHRFAFGDGIFPTTALTAINGVLFGTTANGGLSDCYMGSGCGTIFRFDTASQKFAVLHKLNGTSDPAYPYGRLLFKNGTLYATSQQSGSGYGAGRIFTVDPATGTITTQYAFTGQGDGGGTLGGLTFAHGAFYGDGLSDATDFGTIFKLAP